MTSQDDVALLCSTVDVIEIPEPDYDDDDVENDITRVAGYHGDQAVRSNSEDNNNNNNKEEQLLGVVASDVSPTTIDKPLATGTVTSQTPDSVTQTISESSSDTTLNFSEARNKLEEFCRDDKHLLTGCCLADFDIPEPDYDSDTDSDKQQQQQQLSPVMLTKQQVELCKELQLNNKLGRNVLNQKSELQKELDKRKERQQERQTEDDRKQRQSSLERRLQQQADKLSQAELKLQQQIGATDLETQEFIKIQSKLCKT